MGSSSVRVSTVRRKLAMARNDRNLKALGGASRSATQALDALDSPEYAHVPRLHRDIWVMATVIHCDICRLVVALDECEPGAARLLSMAGVVSKLYEAKKWYLSAGARSLREIAKIKTCGQTYIEGRLKELKAQHPISKIDAYAVFRHKVGHHYDAETPKYLAMFGNQDSVAFYSALMTFVRFSGEWAKLAIQVIQDTPVNTDALSRSA